MCVKGCSLLDGFVLLYVGLDWVGRHEGIRFGVLRLRGLGGSSKVRFASGSGSMVKFYTF